MNKFKQLHKKGWQFVALTIAISAIPYFFIVKEGSTDSSWTLLLMWVPAIASIALRTYHKEGIFSNMVWNPLKGWKWILLAAFIPFFIEIATILLTISLDAAKLKEEFLIMGNGKVSISGIAMLFGASAQPWYAFLPNFILSYFIGTLFYSLFLALGEEFGWRGYLQKEWGATNKLFSFIMIGIIWGLWHLPGILLGHNYPDYPILGGFVLMPMVTILFSIAFGVAFNSKRVIWVPTFFHGAVNISSDISNAALLEASIQRPINDFIWTSLWLLAAILLWKTKKSN